MAIRNIRPDTDEILRKESKQVEVIDNKIRELVIDMLDTMYKFDGVGLAAPQVGILKRIICYDVEKGPNVLINPVIIKKTGCQTSEEGCLSSPNVFGMVDRPETIIVQAINLEGKPVKIKAKDFEAIVISHEIDHLNGILFLDFAKDVYKLTDEEILQSKQKQQKEQYNMDSKIKKRNTKNNNRNIKNKRGKY